MDREQKEEIGSSRARSTSLLVNTLKASKSGTKILVSGSAIGIYGDRGDEVLDETSSPGAGFLAGVCQAWENEASELADSGSTVALLRTGIVMGTTGGALAKQLPLFRWGLGGRLSSGHQWISPISLRDQIGAVLWIIDHDLSGPVNLVVPRADHEPRFHEDPRSSDASTSSRERSGVRSSTRPGGRTGQRSRAREPARETWCLDEHGLPLSRAELHRDRP